MSLTRGTFVGAYEIDTLIGAGGMGEVYRARDSRLGRDVALKVLPRAVSADPERLARFEREARLLATLNHPHIGAIYGLERDGDVLGLVLELIEGETLAQRIQSGPLPVREVLTIARQITDALDAAHAKGIVHRDLKPANITLTHEGVVKVLDFGLAKAAQDRSSSAETTLEATRDGVILGTAAYMSPEQARGRAVDKRTDIWAFGCVLYEMLTGRRTFAGDSSSDILVAILDREPQWDRLPAATPPIIRRLVQRCLEKDPRRRLHDIADARIDVEDALAGSSGTSSPGEVAFRARPRRRVTPALWAAPVLVAGALIGGALVRYVPPRATLPVTRSSITLPEKLTLGMSLALSNDGRTLVYSATDESGTYLYRRSLSSLDAVRIRGSEGGQLPTISPDGKSLAFLVERTLKTLPIDGGVPATLVDVGRVGGAPTWLRDDTIVYASWFRGVMRIPAAGGDARLVAALDPKAGELGARWPIVVPGERTALFTVHYGQRDTQRIHAVSLETGRRVMLVQGNGARYLATGHIVFQRRGSLWVVPFDENRMQLTGRPAPVIDGVSIADDWSPIVAVSANGTLAYAIGGDAYPPRHMVWVDRTGKDDSIGVPPRAWFWPRVSHDGGRIGFHDMDPVNMDAWIYDIKQRALIRMTYSAEQDGFPLWSPDGRHIAFWSRQGGTSANLYVRNADLTGPERRLTTSPNHQTPSGWTPDGRFILFQQDTPRTGLDIGMVPADGSGAPRMLLESAHEESQPAVSPDGRWIAYRANPSGRHEIYVQSFPGLEGRWQISTDGGFGPVWNPKGGELCYRRGRAVISVSVDTSGAGFTFGSPRVLFERDFVQEDADGWSAGSYAMTPDGERFLMMREERPRPVQIVMVQNWIEELRRSGR